MIITKDGKGQVLYGPWATQGHSSASNNGAERGTDYAGMQEGY